MSAKQANQTAPLFIGLTGGIGCGKSTVTERFAALGIDIIDADIIAREVVTPPSPALAAIAQHFGQSILNANGALNRAKLRQIIFSDSREKSWLNALLHPLIRQSIECQLQQATSPYAILVAPLLFENQLDDLVDYTLVIDVTEQTQINRTCQRDHVDEAQVRAIITSQIPRQQRLDLADYILSNDGEKKQLESEISTLHQLFLNFAKAHQ